MLQRGLSEESILWSDEGKDANSESPMKIKVLVRMGQV